ncbi:MAG TPA: GNAT family N-acetyltransferase [Chloroflexi bacterium]|nr:GNAT family N-acetyltransferase [Chloroflexota bacterium]
MADSDCMFRLGRIQDYLRYSAAQQYEVQSLPSFTAYFHPQNDLPYFNYAIPDGPLSEDVAAALDMLREAFERRGRRPRIEFLAECAPELADTLTEAGFIQEARQVLMVCTAQSFRPAPPREGVTVTRLLSDASLDALRRMLDVQRRGFDPESDVAVSEYEAQCFAEGMGGGAAYLAELGGEAVGAGIYMTPWQGMAELTGIATLPAYRRRGIATALVSCAVRDVLAHGAEMVCLIAADEAAGQMYERVGFEAVGTMLAYVVQDIPVPDSSDPSE